MVQLSCGGNTTPVLGIVDSGADATLLPRSTAPDLGLDPNQDLTPVPGGSGGAGGTHFPTWETSHKITGQVIALLPSGPTLWGPVIDLKPKFADAQPALFGRADFFTQFAISFVNDPSLGPVFHLDY